MAGDGSRFAGGTWISDASGSEVFFFDHAAQHPLRFAAFERSGHAIAMSADRSRVGSGGTDKKIHFFDGSLAPARPMMWEAPRVRCGPWPCPTTARACSPVAGAWNSGNLFGMY
ncbi:MAG: hypothetical protein R3B13_12660 [Polyangiaceae bacterium]